jgi:2,4-dienoyl-CoA reductase-like NADH-dependent reductase (Old Yellow Enzyme family)
MANDLLEKDGLDIITVGRGFQKNPGLVFAWADELKQDVQMPNQVSKPSRNSSGRVAGRR